MSSGTKVYSYRCTQCQRVTELVSDNKRADPVRCIITKDCLGFLELQSARRGNRARPTPIQLGVSDRTQRGSYKVPVTTASEQTSFSLSSFSDIGLTIAAVRRVVDGGSSVYSILSTDNELIELETRSSSELIPSLTKLYLLLYEFTTGVLTNQRYSYTFNGAAQVLQGVDDSTEQKLLYFTDSDQLKVLVNGVELAEDQFDRTQPNTIRLTPSVLGARIEVEVYVYKDRSVLINEDKLIRLEFKDAATALRSSGAWGDVYRISIDEQERALSFCTDLSALEVKKTYGIARIEAVDGNGDTTTVEPSELWLLLSDAPHAAVDKRLDQAVNGTTLVDQQFSLSFQLEVATGSIVPITSTTALTSFSTPLAPVAEAEVTTTTAGSDSAYVRRPYAHVIGPA